MGETKVSRGPQAQSIHTASGFYKCFDKLTGSNGNMLAGNQPMQEHRD